LHILLPSLPPVSERAGGSSLFQSTISCEAFSISPPSYIVVPNLAGLLSATPDTCQPFLCFADCRSFTSFVQYERFDFPLRALPIEILSQGNVHLPVHFTEYFTSTQSKCSGPPRCDPTAVNPPTKEAGNQRAPFPACEIEIPKRRDSRSPCC